jgi:lipid-binding SYLF domain-containing protein
VRPANSPKLRVASDVSSSHPNQAVGHPLPEPASRSRGHFPQPQPDRPINSKLSVLLVAGALLAAASSAFAAANSVANLKQAAKGITNEKHQLAVQSALVDFEASAPTKVFFGKAYGVVIFPTVGKGGLGIGGAHGTGWVFRQGQLTGTVTMSQLTIGFQAGGQAFSQLIFLEDETTFNHFTSGNFELGAQASAVALTAGANASASTGGGAAAGAGDSQAKTTYTDGMAIFTKAKGGLMYEASVGGQKFIYKANKK